MSYSDQNLRAARKLELEIAEGFKYDMAPPRH